MIGNKDYLSGGCDMDWCADLPGKLCYEKLDKKNQKNDYMIMPEILIKINLEQTPPPPPSPLKKSDLDSLSKFTY